MPLQTGTPASPAKAALCQLARLGDLAQTLPLIHSLTASHQLKLICDAAVADWVRPIPGIGEILFLDSRKWRQKSTSSLEGFGIILEELGAEVASLTAGDLALFLALNDHPLANLLAAWTCRQDQNRWITPLLILVRSYLRLLAGFHQWNRLHLSDLWRSLNAVSPPADLQTISVSATGTQFAKSVLEGCHRRKNRQLWALILGSGAKGRRLEPEDMAGWWKSMPADLQPGIVLMGGNAERELAQRFMAAVEYSPGISNLAGCCTAEELLGIMESVDLVIGVDTGPLHWAAALGTRVLGMYFGEAGLYDTGPYGADHLVLAPDCPEYPCSPARATVCRLVCRRAYQNHPEMAGFLAALAEGQESTALPPPAGLQLHVSQMTSEGCKYKNLAITAKSAEIEYFASVAASVFHLVTDDSVLLNNLPPNRSMTSQELFGIWSLEIEQLQFPHFISGDIIQIAKRKAREQLQEAFMLPKESMAL